MASTLQRLQDVGSAVASQAASTIATALPSNPTYDQPPQKLLFAADIPAHQAKHCICHLHAPGASQNSVWGEIRLTQPTDDDATNIAGRLTPVQQPTQHYSLYLVSYEDLMESNFESNESLDCIFLADAVDGVVNANVNVWLTNVKDPAVGKSIIVVDRVHDSASTNATPPTDSADSINNRPIRALGVVQLVDAGQQPHSKL